MSNKATFTLHIRNIIKNNRDKMRWVLRMFQSRERSLMLTSWNFLSFSYYSTAASSGIHAKQKTYKLSMLFTNIYIQNYWRTAIKLLPGRLHELELFSLQRHRECYINIIIYISKITQHMVPNIDGTQNKNQKAYKTWNTVCYSVPDKQKPGTIPSKKYNSCIWASVVQLVAKISERHRKC